MAQLADRIMSRAFPTGLVPTERSEGLVQKTLNGLGRVCGMIPTQHERVAAEQARLRIQQVLGVRKERFERFRALRGTMQGMAVPLDETSAWAIHLNPVNCWIRISDEPVSGARDTLAGSVLFFFADNEVRGLRMNLEGQVLMNELADYQPCTIRQWARLSSLADAQQLSAVVQHLAELGLVAIEPTRQAPFDAPDMSHSHTRAA